MAGKKQPNSERAIAARLTVELGRLVTRDCIREWTEKGYPLDDPVALEKRIRNQKRGPKRIRPAGGDADESDDDQPEAPATHLDIEHEMKELQRKLIKAEDYETARTLRMQIAGVRDVLKSLREQKYYVTIESQTRDGMAFSEAAKSQILRIPAELPQMIIGLDYADAVQRCEDYAYGILTTLHQSREGDLRD
jgi:hypothetical protein